MQLNEIKSLQSLYTYLDRLVEGKLWMKVLIGIFLGGIAGVMISPATGLMPMSMSQVVGNWLALPGMLFLKLVQMIMIPLIFASIIRGLGNNESLEQIRTTGLGVLIYFIATTVISISLGLLVGLTLKPGTYFGQKSLSLEEGAETSLQGSGGIPGLMEVPGYISDLLPENPLASMVTGEMLSIVIFAIIIGIAMISLPNKHIQILLDLLGAVQEVCMTVVKWSMRLVPFAVFGLIAQLIANTGIDAISGIGMYILAVIVGLVLLMIVYLILLALLANTNPLAFLKDIRDVQLLAFSTTSSAAVMPLSLKTADEKLKVRPAISEFLIPIGTTINMDGTALYQCISTVFLAQVFGVELTTMNLVLVVVTIVTASIGTPAIPGGGVIVLASVLQSVGIPTSGIVMIIGVDRILGMFRTAVNVTGDLTACMVFNKWSEKK